MATRTHSEKWRATCSDSPRILSVITEVSRRVTNLEGTQANDASLMEGDAGIALLCSQLDRCFPEQGWDVTGHLHIARSLKQLESSNHLEIGMASGLAGIGLAL